jgi:ribonuclease VapC
VVVDTSALLAVCFDEEHAEWVSLQMNENDAWLMMSTANYAEALILIGKKGAEALQTFRDWLQESSIRLVPLSMEQAEIAAVARRKYPLNLGDCFAYALAKENNCPVLTLDSDFRNADVPVVSPRSSSKQ